MMELRAKKKKPLSTHREWSRQTQIKQTANFRDLYSSNAVVKVKQLFSAIFPLHIVL